MQISRIPIINYHKIDKVRDIGITTRHPDDFKRDMEIIRDNGYETITFADLIMGSHLPAKPLIITFDDGYESVFNNAVPVMNELKLRGVIFIPADYIGKYNDWDVQFGKKRFRHMDTDQLKRLINAGFEIGSHTCSHRLLTALGIDEIIREIKQSKIMLENLLMTEIISVSYPFGRYDSDVLKLTRDTGYRFGVSLVNFKKNEQEWEQLVLRRHNIYRFDGLGIFMKKISGERHKLLELRDSLIQKGGLATAAYQKLRKRNFS
ncbi:MAG: polysaccharide deacetylase family protein [Calditrichaceae bacterium]